MTGEKLYERLLVRAVERKGGIALKQTGEYRRGIPDRLILLPGARTEFVELKSDGRKPTRLQAVTHRTLRDMGYTVTVIDSREALENYLNTL